MSHSRYQFRKKWPLSREERIARKLLKGIRTPRHTRVEIEHIARTFALGYAEMLDILSCIADLYTMLTACGYHNPDYRDDHELRSKKRFELVDSYNACMVSNGRLGALISTMVSWRRDSGGFGVVNLLCRGTDQRGLDTGSRLILGKIIQQLSEAEYQQAWANTPEYVGKPWCKPSWWNPKPYYSYWLFANVVPVSRS